MLTSILITSSDADEFADTYNVKKSKSSDIDLRLFFCEWQITIVYMKYCTIHVLCIYQHYVPRHEICGYVKYLCSTLTAQENLCQAREESHSVSLCSKFDKAVGSIFFFNIDTGEM